jgi:hypothetical protein
MKLLHLASVELGFSSIVRCVQLITAHISGANSSYDYAIAPIAVYVFSESAREWGFKYVFPETKGAFGPRFSAGLFLIQVKEAVFLFSFRPPLYGSRSICSSILLLLDRMPPTSRTSGLQTIVRNKN